MTTMAQAIQAFVELAGGPVSSGQIKLHIRTQYPEKWKGNTLQAHLYACSVNNPKAYVHHPSTAKFLYKNADGTFEMYSEVAHGPNEWAPQPEDDELTSAIELEETTLTLERDIEDHLVRHIDQIEKGLKLVGRQVATDIGRIDLLAEDADGRRVVIELKVGDAKDSAVGQIARYLGWYNKLDGLPARGLLIAANFPEGTQYAASAIPGLKLVSYKVHFSFGTVELGP